MKNFKVALVPLEPDMLWQDCKIHNYLQRAFEGHNVISCYVDSFYPYALHLNRCAYALNY